MERERQATRPRGLLRDAVVGAVGIVADAFVFGFCFVTLFFWFAIPFMAIRMPDLADPTTERHRLHATRIGIYLLAAVMALMLIIADARLSERRALLVIAAANDFAADHDAFPDTLDELTPTYLRRIPLARHNLTHPRFHYRESGLYWSSLFFGDRHRCNLRHQDDACRVLRNRHRLPSNLAEEPTDRRRPDTPSEPPL